MIATTVPKYFLAPRQQFGWARRRLQMKVDWTMLHAVGMCIPPPPPRQLLWTGCALAFLHSLKYRVDRSFIVRFMTLCLETECHCEDMCQKKDFQSDRSTTNAGRRLSMRGSERERGGREGEDGLRPTNQPSERPRYRIHYFLPSRQARRSRSYRMTSSECRLCRVRCVKKNCSIVYDILWSSKGRETPSRMPCSCVRPN